MDSYSYFANYIEPMMGSRDHFHYNLEDLAVLPEGASMKYTLDGKVKPLRGLTVVQWVYEDVPLYNSLCRTASRLKQRLDEVGLSKHFAFLPPSTYHTTLADVVIEPPLSDYEPAKVMAQDIFSGIEDQKESEASFFVKDIGVCAGTSVVVWCYPKSSTDLDIVRDIRNRLLPLRSFGEKYLPCDIDRFIGHITLMYIVSPLPRSEYTLFKQVMHEFEKEELGELNISNPEFRKFNSMEEWDTPLVTLHKK